MPAAAFRADGREYVALVLVDHQRAGAPSVAKFLARDLSRREFHHGTHGSRKDNPSLRGESRCRDARAGIVSVSAWPLRRASATRKKGLFSSSSLLGRRSAQGCGPPSAGRSIRRRCAPGVDRLDRHRRAQRSTPAPTACAGPSPPQIHQHARGRYLVAGDGPRLDHVARTSRRPAAKPGGIGRSSITIGAAVRMTVDHRRLRLRTTSPKPPARCGRRLRFRWSARLRFLCFFASGTW